MDGDLARPVKVEAKPGYRVWLEYSDGVTGEVDLSDLVGRGVFAVWNEPGCFEKVYIDSFGAVAWSYDLEICPDALYMEITGKSFEELTAQVESVPLDG